MDLKTCVREIHLLDAETFGLRFVEPPRIEVWRRDQRLMLKEFATPVPLRGLSNLTVTPTRILATSRSHRPPSQYARATYAGPVDEPGRYVPLPPLVGCDLCAVGEHLLSQCPPYHLAALDGRTGEILKQDVLDPTPGRRTMGLTAFRDRIGILRIEPTEAVEIWRFKSAGPEASHGE